MKLLLTSKNLTLVAASRFRMLKGPPCCCCLRHSRAAPCPSSPLLLFLFVSSVFSFLRFSVPVFFFFLCFSFRFQPLLLRPPLGSCRRPPSGGGCSAAVCRFGVWNTALTFGSNACRTRSELRRCLLLLSQRLGAAVLAVGSSSSVLAGSPPCWGCVVVVLVCCCFCVWRLVLSLLVFFPFDVQVFASMLLYTAVHLVVAPPPSDIRANLMRSKVRSAPNGPNPTLSRISFFYVCGVLD